ncbi:hypothetical protein MR532_01265 [bacterium]|nr:hypothetical protein [bacterium]
MKKKKLSMLALMLAFTCLTGTTASAQGELSTDENGTYLIGSKEELQAWSQLSGYEKTNVRLTANIENVDFRLATTNAYTGTFDGGGHTVTLNYNFPKEQTAMFMKFAGTVRNIIVDGSIYATWKNSAALVGTTSGTSTFENTIVLTSIYADCGGNASNAGFVGYSKYATTFTNCISAYKASGVNGYNHGFVGWIGSNAATRFNNCISIMQCELESTMSFANPTGSIKTNNCYAYQHNGDNTPLTGTSYINTSSLESGEICYLLNKGAGKTVFYQTLGEDKYPVPFDTHKQVYGVGDFRCDGTPLSGEISYSNVNSTPLPSHTDVDGRCSVCNNLLPDHIALDEKGFYPLSSVKDVEWFAALVNELHLTTINGKLTADIDYEGAENAHTPIGLNTTYKYDGEFDGQGHRIKNMLLTSETEVLGFFGFVRGGSVIRNLVIDSTCKIKGASTVGALIGVAQTDTGTPLLIENCVNLAEVAGSTSASGFIGSGNSAYPVIKLVNCLNAGDVTGKPATAFCSWINKGGSSLTNCVNTGKISGTDNSGGKFDYLCNLIRYEPNTLTLTNCHDLSETENCGQGVDAAWLTDDPKASGELCYILNGDQSKITWTQTIGSETMPDVFGKSDIVRYVGDAGYATLCNATKDFAINGDAKASIITGAEGTKLVQKYVTNVPAGEGVLLEGTYYNIIGTIGSTDDCTGNKLVGVTEDMLAVAGTYVLQDNDGKVGFYLVAAGKEPTIKAGKAYLQLSGNEAKALFLDGDGATGITEMAETATDGDAEVYNLAGQRVSKAAKGIYIVGGKKVLK